MSSELGVRTSANPGRPTAHPDQHHVSTTHNQPGEPAMKAFTITARDTQPTVQDLPQPEPAPGEVLVEVEAASVNGFDVSVAAGYVWDMLPHEFPVVLGRDLVGTVTAPGADLGPRTGSFADYVALPAFAVGRVPDGVEADEAAVIGLAGIAAHDAID